MTRYYMSVEINCGIEVAVDAASEDEARQAATAAMLIHLDECNGWDFDQRDKPEDRPVLIVGLNGEPLAQINENGEEE